MNYETTKRYKLTDGDMRTYGGCEWTAGEWKETNGGNDLCGSGWLHCYTSPELAVLLNPIHADIRLPRLWECEVDGESKSDHGLKEGWTRVRLVREIELPSFTCEQRVYFAILCASTVNHDAAWAVWAEKWVSGTDRPGTYFNAYAHGAASAAKVAAVYVDRAAVLAARAAAVLAARAAAYAAVAVRFDLMSIARKALAWKDPRCADAESPST